MTAEPRPAPVWLAVRRLATETWRLAGWRVCGVVAVVCVSGVASGASVLLLIVVLQSLGLSGSQPPTSRLFAEVLRLAGGHPSVGAALGMLVAATAIQGLLSRVQALQTLSLVDDVSRGVRRRLFGELCRVPWNVYARFRQSDLVEVVSHQATRVGLAARGLVMLAAALVTAAVYGTLAAGISLLMTGLVLAFGAGLTMLLTRDRRAVTDAGERYLVANRRLFGSIMDALSGMKTLRAHGAEQRHAAALETAEMGLHAVHLRLVGAETRMRFWFDVGAMGLLAGVTLLATARQTMSPAELLVLVFVFFRLAPQVSSLHHQFQSVLAEIPSLAAVESFEGTCAASTMEQPARQEPVAFEREIRLEGVDFAYGDEPVLRGLDLTIPAGRTIAIVGPSGAGKSTVADLVLGLLAPTHGRVLVDGQPLTPDRVATWRAMVGYVPQDTFLYHDTIRANLRSAAPEANEADLQAALQAAGAEFVDRLPEGLETPTGDRGVLLSGGERQRLALAQALLRRPRLLILDEATSALDAESERTIERAIANLHGHVTILQITHRLSTARRADLIYVLDRGRIVESGREDELRVRPFGRFRRLSDAQDLAPVPAAPADVRHRSAGGDR